MEQFVDDSHGDTLYPYVLDHKPGFFLGWFLYRLFKKVSIEEHLKQSLKKMHREGAVVYAVKYRGQLDYLLYHYNFRRNRLPYPRIAFDLNISLFLPLSKLLKIMASRFAFFLRIGRLPNPYQSGFYKKAIQEGTTSLIFLVDPKGFIRRFIHAEKDPLQFLLETQREMDRPIFVVPQLILYKKTPEKEYTSFTDIFFGFKDHVGVIRKIVLFFRHHRHAVIDFGQPLNLKSYLQDQAPSRALRDMAEEIRQTLIEGIDAQKRIILGPIMKSRQQVKEIVLTGDRIRHKIEDLAGGDKEKRRQLRKEAGEYFDEIAADYNVAYVQFMEVLLNWLWKRIFRGIDVDEEGLARVREWARKRPLIFVPSHKSHIDYLLLNYVLFNHNMHVPRIAAGKNLTFWPMGHIFRKSGAFFLRRSFRGAKLYSEIFTRYIKALLEEGHPIEFYIEGGRSRNGKLVYPKTGFLSILLRAYQEGFCEDLIFVPTSIIYDRVLEGASYLKEIGGGTKETESFGQIVRARRFLKMSYGKVYIRFNQPFSLNEYLAQTGQTIKGCHRELAFHLMESINSVSIVTPLSLIATAILANHRRGFNLSELRETVSLLLEFFEKRNIPMAVSLSDPEKAIHETLSLLIDWKIIDYLEDAAGTEETFYYADDEKKLELEYHKNSIIHFFIPYAFTAISLLNGVEEAKPLEPIIEDYLFLKDLFEQEFVFHKNEDHRAKVLSALAFFLDSGFLTREEGREEYRVTKLGHDRLPIWGALTKTFLESYWIAARAMSQQKKDGEKNADLLKNMNYLGRRFHKLGLIDHIGALSQLNYKNAMTSINRRFVVSPGGSDQDPSSASDGLANLSKRLYELCHAA